MPSGGQAKICQLAPATFKACCFRLVTVELTRQGSSCGCCALPNHISHGRGLFCVLCVCMCTVSGAQQYISANGRSLYPILNKSGMLFRCKMAEGMPPVLPLIQMPEEGRQSMPLPLGPSRIRPQQTLNSHPDSKHGSLVTACRTLPTYFDLTECL